MKINKITAITVTIIVTLTLAFIVIFWSIYKKIETAAVPESEAPQGIEIKEDESKGYAIPENAIPTEADIENRINKDKERNSIAEQAQAARRSAREKVTPITAEEPVGQPKKPAEAIPVKKEVKFPTYEERKAQESQSGTVSY